MSLDEVVYHLLDSVDVKLASGVRIEHCRLIDMLLLEGTSCFNCEKLNVDIGHVHSRALNGESTYVGGCDTVTVYKAGNLYASLCREVSVRYGLLRLWRTWKI